MEDKVCVTLHECAHHRQAAVQEVFFFLDRVILMCLDRFRHCKITPIMN